MGKSLLAAALGLVMLPACGATERLDDLRTQPKASANQRYEVDTTVLESAEHGPMLCLGGMRLSLPPQCGDVPIANWDWKKVAGEERRGGTIWGTYHVVGTFDGRTFTLLEAGAPRGGEDFPGGGGEIGTPCPEPEGGWRAPDPSRWSREHLGAATRAAESQPDFAGLWVDYVSPYDPKALEDPTDVILNVAFTGNLERHESELRARWGGPLCLTRHERTFAELHRIQSELSPESLSELGLQMLFSNVDVVDNVVELGVVAIDDETRKAIDVRYGDSVVRVSVALRPAVLPG